MAPSQPQRQNDLRDRLGRALRDLRISVIDRCNFRCGYCMPEDAYHENYQFLNDHQRLTAEEIERLASAFVAAGTRKLRLTGGEPLMRREIVDIVERLAVLGGVEDLALTTNGVLLERRARALRDAGLQRVTVSLDALDEATFARMNGRGVGPDRVLAGIEAAIAAGLTPVKINVVVQRGVNEHSVLPILEYFRSRPSIVRFIEYMDVGACNGWRRDAVTPSAELLELIAGRFPLEPLPPRYPGEVASRYGFRNEPGEIGFISSVTQPFCGGCTRARLSSDGKLYTCLFASDGVDLREPLRSGAAPSDLLCIIEETWRRRADRYSELRAQQSAGDNPRRRVEMFEIGG
jgi:cyclic pyranopterin phosphate synthase